MARPRLSIVVPVYNVEGYLPECLDSIRSQAGPDVEIVAVNDGSTDSSEAILAETAAADPRLTVLSQANQGLGAARNHGAAAAEGEYLWFVDSDDRLAPGAIDLLLTTIAATGSDLVSGNVHRLVGESARPARFLADAFARTRLRTHITRFPALIADRVAWNKVFRRSFWDRHDFRFPVGVHYEDQYVALPAHYLARSVDVRSEPVYLWRVRDSSAASSITQQRSDIDSMRDRVAAVRFVSDFLAGRGSPRERRRYDESAVTHDLRYFLEVVPDAGEDYRQAFLEAVAPYLAGVDETAYARLPAVRRMQWRMVRRGDLDRLVDLLEAERGGPRPGSARRRGRHWYVELPGLDDPELRLGDDDYRVRRELRLVSTIAELSIEADEIMVAGHAEIELVGPVRRRLALVAVPLGRGRPLWARTTVTADGDYQAGLPLRPLLAASARAVRRWRLILVAGDYRLRRVASWHEARAGGPASASRALTSAGRLTELRLDLSGRGRLVLTAGSEPGVVDEIRLDETGALDLLGTLDTAGSAGASLVAEDAAGRGRSWPLHVDPGAGARRRFVGRLPLADLAPGTSRLAISVGGVHRRLALATAAIDGAWPGGTVTVTSAGDGYLQVVSRKREG